MSSDAFGKYSTEEKAILTSLYKVNTTGGVSSTQKCS